MAAAQAAVPDRQRRREIGFHRAALLGSPLNKHGPVFRLALGSRQRTSFLKKRSKKLLVVLAAAFPLCRVQFAKVFWFFFSKKNRFLSLSRYPTA
jgi:hypothetical protein